MADANTRAHVASPTAKSLIPAADPQTSNSQTSPPQPPPNATVSYPVFNLPTPPQSRKEKRTRRKESQKYDSAQPTPNTTDNESSPSRTPPNNPPKIKKQPKPTNPSASPHLPPQMKPSPTHLSKSYPLLIASIGNPGPLYSNTLHSAGHILTSYLSSQKNYRPFTKSLSGLVSYPDTTHYSWGFIKGYTKVRDGARPPPEDEDWTFWQSTSLMNVSGVSVKRAYGEWRRIKGVTPEEGRLVVVHDELEAELGKVTVREGASSAKGHNGVKSCQQHLGGVKWWRVGVGIGRPESRDKDVVSRYVLGKMSGGQRKALEGSAVKVFEALEGIAAGKR
ncbi:peptidyl-tRNA hydrolase [Plenodomus tracheiphilus IPT5]|uniref:peptidyl-tRNA hydrolase n=1 Tax=Plenodomus tracheiphilus IPT5 TaxID=1408161 RepID=A0A6A7AVA7_9PLEO|nr:peptidyl-tRNA hydrolase [Plenodomus tracheiphilus IPT5]